MTESSVEDLLAAGALARRERRSGDALRHYGEAVAASRRSGRRDDLARSLAGLAQIERDLDRLEPARLLYEETVSLRREEAAEGGDPFALAHAVRHLGDVYRHQARPDLAEPLYREALALYRSRGGAGALDLANALRPLAILLEDGGRPADARPLWTAARELYRAAGVEAGVQECERHLAAPRAVHSVRFGRAEPILSVRDVEASVRYYVSVLGFENAEWGGPDFTRVRRDGAGIYLCRGAQGNPGTWVWVGVADAAALYEEYRASGARIRQPPVLQPWALELQVEDLDGHVLRLGSDSDDDEDD